MASYRHTLITWPLDPTPMYLLKRKESLCSLQNLHTNVHSGSVHKCPNLRATEIPSDEWIGGTPLGDRKDHTGWVTTGSTSEALC